MDITPFLLANTIYLHHSLHSRTNSQTNIQFDAKKIHVKTNIHFRANIHFTFSIGIYSHQYISFESNIHKTFSKFNF
jgi:hypothetical protein